MRAMAYPRASLRCGLWLALSLGSLAACGGAAKAKAPTAPAAPAPDPQLASLLSSTLPLPAEATKQSDCAGAATLGALVQSVLTEHPTWTARVHCEAELCSAGFTPPEAASADPCSGEASTGLTMAFQVDAAGVVVADGLECWWQ